MKRDKYDHLRKHLILAVILILPFVSFSQEATVQNSQTYFSNALFNTLLLIIAILAIMVIAIGNALKNVIGSDMFREKIKKENEEKNSTAPKVVGIIIFFLLTNLSSYSQEKAIQIINDDKIGGLDQFTFYLMIITIALELLVLGVLFNTFKNILGVKKVVKPVIEIKANTKTILDKLNGTVAIELEETIMLDHDYDGIKELDNNLPPWWKYGFYLTIVIAIIYMINYHVAKTAPLQAEEYANSIKKAEIEIAAYMKTSADNVDESTVKLLTDPSEINAGKDIFISTCAACHGKYGEGTVGPNLTDDYWVHGGGVKDIFKTIKYGWPDKGMKSWKEDFSPVQIAQLASFIKTLKGTNPPKPKDKQGELYIEQNTPSDTTAIKVDSTKTRISELLQKKN